MRIADALSAASRRLTAQKADCDFGGIRRPIERSKKARYEPRWLHHHVRLYAGCWIIEQPHGRMLSHTWG